MKERAHLQILSHHIICISLRHPDKDSHGFCDIMSVLDVEEQFQCFVRQELCYVLPDCIKGGN